MKLNILSLRLFWYYAMKNLSTKQIKKLNRIELSIGAKYLIKSEIQHLRVSYIFFHFL